MEKELNKIFETPDQFIDRVLNPEYIAELMDEHDHQIRGGLFHPAMTVWLMMYQRLSDKASLIEAVQAFHAGVGGVLNNRSTKKIEEASFCTGGFSQARTRLPEKAVEEIVDTLNEAIIGSHPEHHWNGRHVYALDGTDFRVLAGGDLLKEFPPSRNSKNKSPWSTIRSVIATHITTGVALRAANGPMYGKKAVGEVSLSRDVISQLPENSVAVVDGGIGTFIVAYTAIKAGHDVLFALSEVRAKQALGKSCKKDGELSCTWKPGHHTQRKYPEIPEEAVLNGRMIRYTVKQPGFKQKVLYLFTTLKFPVEQIIELYALRWNIETDFRTLKTAMKMELLDVRSASMARKEIALGIAAYNIVRHLLAYAAHEANLKPRDISFTSFATRIRYVGMSTALKEITDANKIAHRLIDRLSQLAHPKRKKRKSRPRKILRHPQQFPHWTTKSRAAYAKKGNKLAKWH